MESRHVINQTTPTPFLLLFYLLTQKLLNHNSQRLAIKLTVNETEETPIRLIVIDHQPLSLGLKVCSDRNQIRVAQPTHVGHMLVENLAARNRSLIRVHSLHRQTQLVIQHRLVRRPNRTSPKQLRRGSHQHLQVVHLCLSSTEHQVTTLLYPS